MIKVENIDVYGFETAIRGMRNPMNSWERSDSRVDIVDSIDTGIEPIFVEGYVVGENDLDLMHRLFKAGTEHRKYLRMITVTMDITAPLYWWKEFDTYKVGTVCNSCSTMHKIHAKKFTMDDFSHDHLDDENMWLFQDHIISRLNSCRDLFISTKDKHYWWQMIQLLPSSYNQKRTIMMNYEVVYNILRQRKNHKLDEWNELCEILKELPYIKKIMEGGVNHD